MCLHSTVFLVFLYSVVLLFINQNQIGNVIYWASSILPFKLENILWTGAWLNVTDQFVFDGIMAAQANFALTIGVSIGLIVLGFMLHATNFAAWWRAFKAAPMAVITKKPVGSPGVS